MSSPEKTDITTLLEAVNDGDTAARSRLWRTVYDELHAVAKHLMGKERSGKTIQTTAVVHETFLRLLGGQNVSWANRRHFFGAAAEAMRRILIDDARKRKRLKRGGDRRAQVLHDSNLIIDGDHSDLIDLDDALEKLRTIDPRMAEVVMLRFYANLSVDETAAAMELSPRTVDSEWCFARAWLRRALSGGSAAGAH